MDLTKENCSLMYMIMESNIKVADYICYCNQNSAFLSIPMTGEEKDKMVDMLKGSCGIITYRMMNNKDNHLKDYYESILEEKVNMYFMELSGENNPKVLPRTLLNYTLHPQVIRYEMANELLNNAKNGNHEDEMFLGEITVDTFLVKMTRKYGQKYQLTETQAMTICFLGLVTCSKHFNELMLSGKEDFKQEYEAFVNNYINIAFCEFKKIFNNEPEEKDNTYTFKNTK